MIAGRFAFMSDPPVSTVAAERFQPAWWLPVKGLEEVSFLSESRAVVKLVGIEISRSLDKICVNEGYSALLYLKVFAARANFHSDCIDPEENSPRRHGARRVKSS